MSCSAKKDPNGTWRIQYRWTDWTGTKRKSQKRGFQTKKEAEEWYARFLLQQSSDPTMTLADFWEIYKTDMEKRLRKTTMKQKEYVMKDKVLPYFGKTPINEITAPMIRKWQGEMMEKGFRPTYLKTIQNQLALKEYMATLYRARPTTRLFAGRTKSFFEHEMERGIKLSGVKKITIHCTRHNHASMLVQMGFSPIEIAKRLGHGKVTTTIETYCHQPMDAQRKIADRLGKVERGEEHGV